MLRDNVFLSEVLDLCTTPESQKGGQGGCRGTKSDTRVWGSDADYNVW